MFAKVKYLLAIGFLFLIPACVTGQATGASSVDIDATVEARLALIPTPTPQIITQEVEVIKEVIVEKEVPIEVEVIKEVIVEKEVIIEVPKEVEVIKEVVIEKIVEVIKEVVIVKEIEVEKEVIVEVLSPFIIVVTATPTPTPTPIKETTIPSNLLSSSQTPTPLPGTQVGNMMLSQDTTWTLAGSPYYIQGTVQVPEDITLTIESGVTVIGDGGTIVFAGTVKVNGTESNKIMIEGDSFFRSTYSVGGKIIIRHSVIKNMNNPVGGRAVFELYDSLLENVTISNGLTMDFHAERNKFVKVDLGYIVEGPVTILNNCFFGNPPMLLAALFNGDNRLNFNSIYGVQTGKFEHTLKATDMSINIDASNNYWDGLTEAEVKIFVYDKTVDINLKSTIQILPMLELPHPDTPSCN